MKKRIHLALVRLAHGYLRRSGFVLLDRTEYTKARIYLDRVETRAKRLTGGRASRKTVGEQCKSLRRLAGAFNRYLSDMDKETV